MKQSYFYLFFLFFWLPLIQAEAIHAEAVSQNILPTQELIQLLQSGGNIIYMRHGATLHTQKDTDRNKLSDCSKQRNLSVQGREQVIKIGQTISALKIPLGEILSSPYCRCKETTKLAFGSFEIEPKLAFSISKNKEESRQLGKYLYEMMNNAQVDQKNTVFVGHTSNLKDGLGIWPKPEGVIVVFSKHNNQLIFRGMITPDEWPAMDQISRF